MMLLKKYVLLRQSSVGRLRNAAAKDISSGVLRGVSGLELVGIVAVVGVKKAGTAPLAIPAEGSPPRETIDLQQQQQ